MLSEAQKKRAIDLARLGLTLKKIREDIGVDHNTWYAAIDADVCFKDSVAQARSEGLEERADDLMDITEIEPDIMKARLISDNTKWLLARLKPATYGDKMTLDVNQTVDIGGALREARARALPVSDQTDATQTDVVELPRLSARDVTDSVSVANEADDIFS